MKDDDICVWFCNPKDAVEFLSGEDAEVIEGCIVMSPLIPEGEVTIAPKDEFLEWLKNGERKTGKWIVKRSGVQGLGDIYICPFCKHEVDCTPENFCGNCGARMES